MFREVRIVSFNAENFFLNVDQLKSGVSPAKMTESEWQAHSGSVYDNKPIRHVRAIATLLQKLKPDVVGWCELGGPDSLRQFHQHFWTAGYQVLAVEGNSDRGIDIGFSVAPGLKCELRSHKDRQFHTAAGAATYFSRDVAELRLLSNEDSVVAVFLLVHLKSKWDREGTDPFGSYQREAEFKELLRIASELRSELGADPPVVLMGDFNGRLSGEVPEPEFASLSGTEFRDVLHLCEVPDDNRFTQVQVLSGGLSQVTQLDYILIEKRFRENVKSAWVHRFEDEWGSPLATPKTMNQKMDLPSDHYPVVAELILP